MALYGKGYFCAPTLVDNLPYSHKLWKHEMFLPISTIGKVKNLDEAMQHANDVAYGLTAGIYGNDQEIATFFDKIEAGVNYANRPQGATTGAWPGFQPFGGWKGSGSSGKNAGGVYYVQLVHARTDPYHTSAKPEEGYEQTLLPQRSRPVNMCKMVTWCMLPGLPT